MPTFMNFHPNMQLSPERLARLRAETQSGTVDAFGVRLLELFYSPDGKGAYCLLEAPDEEAVRQHHRDESVEVLRVESLFAPAAGTSAAPGSA